MNSLKRIFISSLTSIIIISCAEPVPEYSRVDFVIPPHINISQDELTKNWPDKKRNPASPVHIVITLYSYSSGSETITFSDTGEMKTITGKASLKCLVKVMRGKEILRAEFLEVSGSSKEDIINFLINQVRDKLFK
jgi:hypothetical protein